MINAEELKELIEKEATIYNIQCDKLVRKINFADKSEGTYVVGEIESINSSDFVLELNNENENVFAWTLQQLYKTKSEAEFVAKYKNIERTETLDLPTWEEAEIDKLVEISKQINNCWYLIKSFTDKKNNEMFEFSLSKDDDQFYLSVNNEDSSYKDLFYNLLTYENYLKACELCKKLFISEEV